MHRPVAMKMKRRISDLSEKSSDSSIKRDGVSRRDSTGSNKPYFPNRMYLRKSSSDQFGSSRSIERINEEVDDSESIISSECQEVDIGLDLQTQIHNATLQIQEIWPTREVSSGLSTLPGSQEILSLLQTTNIEDVVAHPHSQTTGLLLASWLDKQQVVEALLKAGAEPNVRDGRGRTPLHLAASVRSAECLALLLNHGASTEVYDTEDSVTPLHCAASTGSVECVQLLLAAGANIEAGVSSTGSGKPPLHYAVQSNAIQCLQQLINNGAQVNMPQVFTETPLHVAAGLGFSDCTRILLENGADFRVQYSTCKSTPLHLAAEDGNAECARLLIDAGADINKTTAKKQTPLHLAALAQSAKTLELLLKVKSNTNAQDIDKRTPLHCAIVKGSRSCECIQLLLQYGADVNAADAFGYTPVHIAALNDFTSCLRLLLDHGGDVTKKTNGNISALSFIARRTPEILKYLETKLDDRINLYDHEIGDTDCEVQLDFQILVPDIRSGETGLLLTFIEVGQKRLLRHPLCETFLFLKWRRIRKYFILSLIIHAVYVVLCSTYILNVLKEASELTPGYVFLNIALVVSNLSILGKEVFQIAHTRRGYIYQWENWLQWLIILTVFVTLVPPSWLTPEYAFIQHHISVFGIFFNWIELMVLMGRFPMFGIYVQMFTTGSVNFSKFLLAYCCLLFAFAFSFRMTFPKYKAFQDISISIVKTIVMMTGELEFEDIFFPEVQRSKSVFSSNQNVPYPGTAHVFFLFFILVVTIVLTNLLVGLSVSDIQGLQRSAGLDRLARQVELIAYMESMLFSRLLHWIPPKLLLLCRRSAILLSSPHQRKKIIRPNDPREDRLPSDLLKAIYKCVAERKPGKSKGKAGEKSKIASERVPISPNRPYNVRF